MKQRPDPNTLGFHNERSFRWAPLVSGLGVLTLTTIVLFWLHGEEKAFRRQAGLFVAQDLQANISNLVQSENLALSLLSLRWRHRAWPAPEDWLRDASVSAGSHPNFEALLWADESLQLRLSTANPLAPPDAAALVRRLPRAVPPPTEAGRVSIAGSVSLAGRKAVVAYVPVFPNGRFSGYFIAILRVPQLFEGTLSTHLERGYGIRLTDSGGLLFGASPPGDAPWVHELQIPVASDWWRVAVWPTATLSDSQQSPLPRLGLFAGLVISLLFALQVRLAQDARKHARQVDIVNNQLGKTMAERKRAEELLKASEIRFRELFEDAPIAYHELDSDGVVRRVNRAECELLGFDRDEILHRPVWDLVAPESREAAREAVLRKLSGSMPVAPLVRDHLRRDGTRLSIEIHEDLIVGPGGEICGLRSALVDVTERKRAYELLRESEERYRDLFENANDLIVVTNLRGGFLSFNRAAEGLTGYSREQAMQMSLLDIVVAEDHEAVSAMMHGKIHGESGASLEISLQARDGHRVILEINTRLLREDGKPAAIQAIGRDVTERKRAEEVARQKTEELARSNAELEQFAYVASHDLQEPLRTVATSTQMLARRYADKLDGDALRLIDFAVDGARRMQRQIADLLAYSRVTSKADPFEAVEIAGAYKHAVANLDAAINDTGAAVTNDPLPAVLGDKSQLSRLLQNLIGNAIKFNGGQAPRVHVGAEAQNGHWVFSVRDNGIGIDPARAEQIFMIFQRLHTQAEYPGTGIGLAICKKIVERHGGRIWVDSTPGNGSTFYFTVPRNATSSS